MTNPAQAKKATVNIGSVTVDGFQMPDGSYRMSIGNAATAIGTSEQNAIGFLYSESLRSLIGKSYTPETVEVNSEPNTQKPERFNVLPLEVVTAYWLSECLRGNQQAIALMEGEIAKTYRL